MYVYTYIHVIMSLCMHEMLFHIGITEFSFYQILKHNTNNDNGNIN